MKWEFQISQFLSFDYLDYLVEGQREDTFLTVMGFVDDSETEGVHRLQEVELTLG